jgi:hypothetical protein
MSMIDELAKAMAKAGLYDWDSFGDNAREMFRRDVRAVLRRLREPTPGMKEACLREMTNPTIEDPKVAAWHAVLGYTAMIDAALGEKA